MQTFEIEGITVIVGEHGWESAEPAREERALPLKLLRGWGLAAGTGPPYLGQSEVHHPETKTSAIHLTLQALRSIGERAHAFGYTFSCLGRKNTSLRVFPEHWIPKSIQH